MSTQPAGSGVEGAAGKYSASIRLTGGHAEKPRTIEAYRAGNHIDVELHSSEGRTCRAHRLVLMAGSDYFNAAFAGGWADTGPLVLRGVPALVERLDIELYSDFSAK